MFRKSENVKPCGGRGCSQTFTPPRRYRGGFHLAFMFLSECSDNLESVRFSVCNQPSDMSREGTLDRRRHARKRHRANLRSSFSWLRNALVFTLCFVGTSVLIGFRLPLPEVSVVSQKLRQLQRHGDEYDVLFIGSSRVYHQIIPGLFDQLMGDAGIQTRSFNLGADGMRPPEDAFVLEHALAGRRKPIRWVIAEGNSIRFPINKNVTESDRAVYWRDASRMGWLLKRTLLGKDPTRKDVVQRIGELSHESFDMWGHCLLWLPNATHVGRGASMLSAASGASAESDRAGERDSYPDGFCSPGNAPMSAKINADYCKDMIRLHRAPSQVDYADPTSQDLLKWTQQLVARAGGKLILIVPPTTNDSKFYPEPARGSAPLTLDFLDPDRYAELYAPTSRKDTGHLSLAGAQILTRLLAERLIADGASDNP
jgi:hypothetical protein